MKKWQRDKWKHFIVGIPLGALLQWMAGYMFLPNGFAAFSASIVALLLICYGFELFSLVTGKGHYEFMDAIAGIAGGLIGIVLTAIIV